MINNIIFWLAFTYIVTQITLGALDTEIEKRKK